MKAPRFTLDQLRPGLQEQVVKALHGPLVCKSSTPRAPELMGATKTPPTSSLPPGRKKRGQRVSRTRNGGTWTEARYWRALRSHLRRLFRFWKPAQEALKAARVPGGRGRVKFAYLCADCEKVFRRCGVQIDHVVPCGELTCLDHLPGFLARLTPEDPAAYRIRCLSCHQDKTDVERGARG